MKNNKKMKIILGTCIPVATLGVAAGVAGIVIGINKSQDVGKYTVKFDANGGKITNGISSTKVQEGKTLEHIKQACVQSANKDEAFLRWVDENGNQVTSDSYITRDMTLKAEYANTVTDNVYGRVTFEPADASKPVYIYGNTTVAVLKGITTYAMINRPYATLANNEFKGWSLDGSTEIPASTVFTADATKLTPLFEANVTLNFNIGDGATIKYGKNTETLSGTRKFGDFNKPQLENIAKPYLTGWYKDSNFTEIWNDNDLVEDGATAYAKWEATPSDVFATLTCVADAYYDEKGDESGTATVKVAYGNGNSSMQIRKELPWSNVNKPTVKAVDDTYGDSYYKNFTQKVDTNGNPCWQYYNGSAWVNITSTTKFTANTNVRPVLTKVAKEVHISGEKSISSSGNKTYKYYGWAPCGAEQKFTWSVRAHQIGTTAGTWITDISKIASDCNIKVTIDEDPTEPLKISMFNAAGEIKADEIQLRIEHKYASSTYLDFPNYSIAVNQPYTNSDLCWVYYDGSWCHTTIENMCSEDEIVLTKYDGTVLSGIARSAFGSADASCDVYVGDRITTLPANFMSGCTGFKKAVYLKNVVQIEDGFMNDCSAFNQKLDISKVTTIGNKFMMGCTTYNQEMTLNAITIGNHFLRGCSAFNSAITWNNTTHIGEGFLAECSSFGSGDTPIGLSLPTTLTSAGSLFMYHAGGFKGTITVPSETVGNAFTFDQNSLCGNPSDNIYTTGFSVAGNGKTAFASKFPSQEISHPGETTGETINCYRTNKSEVLIISGSDYCAIGSDYSQTYTVSRAYIKTPLTATWSIASKPECYECSITNDGVLTISSMTYTFYKRNIGPITIRATVDGFGSFTKQVYPVLKIQSLYATTDSTYGGSVVSYSSSGDGLITIDGTKYLVCDNNKTFTITAQLSGTIGSTSMHVINIKCGSKEAWTDFIINSGSSSSYSHTFYWSKFCNQDTYKTITLSGEITIYSRNIKKQP